MNDCRLPVSVGRPLVAAVPKTQCVRLQLRSRHNVNVVLYCTVYTTKQDSTQYVHCSLALGPSPSIVRVASRRVARVTEGRASHDVAPSRIRLESDEHSDIRHPLPSASASATASVLRGDTLHCTALNCTVDRHWHWHIEIRRVELTAANANELGDSAGRFIIILLYYYFIGENYRIRSAHCFQFVLFCRVASRLVASRLFRSARHKPLLVLCWAVLWDSREAIICRQV